MLKTFGKVYTHFDTGIRVAFRVVCVVSICENESRTYNCFQLYRVVFQFISSLSDVIFKPSLMAIKGSFYIQKGFCRVDIMLFHTTGGAHWSTCLLLQLFQIGRLLRKISPLCVLWSELYGAAKEHDGQCSCQPTAIVVREATFQQLWKVFFWRWTTCIEQQQRGS